MQKNASQVKIALNGLVGSMAERVKMSFLRRPWSHDLGSTRTLVMFLHKSLYDDYLCLVGTNKQQI